MADQADEITGMNEDMPVPITLSRKHYVRLRQYWQAGPLGLASTGDGIALDLCAAGYLEAMERAVLHLRITQAGIEGLHAESLREKARRQPHHDFAERLADWLQDAGRKTWTNIEFKVDLEGGGRRAVRPDVFSMACTLTPERINPAVHEVKVSRADFLADLANPEKRGGYAALAEVIYYAAPEGIIDPSELPAAVGLVLETIDGHFRVAKKPVRSPVQLGPRHFMNLILKPGSAKSVINE